MSIYGPKKRIFSWFYGQRLLLPVSSRPLLLFCYCHCRSENNHPKTIVKERSNNNCNKCICLERQKKKRIDWGMTKFFPKGWTCLFIRWNLGDFKWRYHPSFTKHRTFFYRYFLLEDSIPSSIWTCTLLVKYLCVIMDMHYWSNCKPSGDIIYKKERTETSRGKKTLCSWKMKNWERLMFRVPNLEKPICIRCHMYWNSQSPFLLITVNDDDCLEFLKSSSAIFQTMESWHYST